LRSGAGRSERSIPSRPSLPPPVAGPETVIDGEAARDHLAILINDRPVTSLPMDAYGRTVAGLFEGGRDICAAMIADGSPWPTAGTAPPMSSTSARRDAGVAGPGHAAPSPAPRAQPRTASTHCSDRSVEARRTAGERALGARARWVP
jgi:hypothetical protein